MSAPAEMRVSAIDIDDADACDIGICGEAGHDTRFGRLSWGGWCRRVTADARNHQLGWAPETEELLVDGSVIVDTVSRGCAGCPGACCAAFLMDQHKITANAEAVAAGQRAGDSEEDREARFIANNFFVLHPHEKQTCSFVMSCRKFEPATGKCTAYDERPGLCRSFACGNAVRGKPPPAPDGGGLEAFSLVSDHPQIKEWRAGSAYKRWLTGG